MSLNVRRSGVIMYMSLNGEKIVFQNLFLFLFFPSNKNISIWKLRINTYVSMFVDNFKFESYP